MAAGLREAGNSCDTAVNEEEVVGASITQRKSFSELGNALQASGEMRTGTTNQIHSQNT
jgi:hypothetical protein